MKKIKVDPATAVGYIRVSTEDQALSPEAQRSAIEKFCREKGLKLASVFADIGVSGDVAVPDRKGLSSALEALSFLRAGQFIVSRWDRLARDAALQSFIVRLLARMGVAPASADGVGNGNAPEAGLIRGIMAQFAEYEKQLISTRTKLVLHSKRARGERIGGIPYGWAKSINGTGLVRNEKEQQLVDLMLQWFRDGQSPRQITNTLNKGQYPARGLARTPNNPGRWYVPTIERILQRNDALIE